MQKANQQARLIWPYLLPLVQRAVSSAGGSSGSSTGVGGAPSPHGLNSIHHTGTLTDAQGPQFMLVDGSRDLTGHLAVDAGITIDGVDLSAHVADPDAHHARATAGNTGIGVVGQAVSLALSATSGLLISSGLKVGAGDGIDVLANTIAVDVTDIIDTAYGLTEDTNNIRINKATDSGLAFNGSGQLTLGTPTAVSVSSVNALTGMGVSHSHAVTASSDVSAGVASLLKSTPEGGLGLASLVTSGAVDVGQGFTAGNNTIRMIYHTHDYPHTHMVVNPTALWNLDEQFGLDIDDNLLVRGWIAGKHAIQVDGATMLAHFDGPPPFETNWVGNPTGHMGQVATVVGDVTYYEGKFGSKAVGISGSGENMIRNPIMAAALTSGWLGSGALSSERAFVGAQSAYYSGAATQVLRTSGYNIPVAAGAKVWLSAWVWCSEVGMAQVRAFDATDRATSSANQTAKQWENLAVFFGEHDGRERQYPPGG